MCSSIARVPLEIFSPTSCLTRHSCDGCPFHASAHHSAADTLECGTDIDKSLDVCCARHERLPFRPVLRISRIGEHLVNRTLDLNAFSILPLATSLHVRISNTCYTISFCHYVSIDILFLSRPDHSEFLIKAFCLDWVYQHGTITETSRTCYMDYNCCMIPLFFRIAALI